MANSALHNESQLLLKVSEGNSEAFRSLFQHYYGQMYTIALIYIKIHEKAEDIVQQVFLKIWEKRSTLPTLNDFHSYIFIMARNEIIDTLRKQSRFQQYINHIGELIGEEKDSPEDQLIIKQERALIQKALEILPHQQKQAYRLSRDKGFSYEEIASDMNLSVSTVKGHISNALKGIRKFLAAHKSELSLLGLIFF